jgi:hypothetical protein
MSSKPPSGLGGILKIGLTDQSDHKIINRSHDFASIANGHARDILFEGYISSVMQSCFNAPMSASKTQQACRRNFGA